MKLNITNVNLKQKPNQRESILFGLTLFVFLFCFLSYVYNPTKANIKLKQDKVASFTEKKDSLSTLAKVPVHGKKKNLAAKLLLSAREKEAVGSYDELTSAAGTFIKTAQNQQFRIIGSKYSDLEKEGSLLKQNVELAIHGPFHQIGMYLESLEQTAPPLIVNEISIIVNTEKMDHVTVEIKGSLYGLEE